MARRRRRRPPTLAELADMDQRSARDSLFIAVTLKTHLVGLLLIYGRLRVAEMQGLLEDLVGRPFSDSYVRIALRRLATKPYSLLRVYHIGKNTYLFELKSDAREEWERLVAKLAAVYAVRYTSINTLSSDAEIEGAAREGLVGAIGFVFGLQRITAEDLPPRLVQAAWAELKRALRDDPYLGKLKRRLADFEKMSGRRLDEYVAARPGSPLQGRRHIYGH